MWFRHFSLVFVWVFVICGLYAIPGYDIKYNDPWSLLTIDKLAHMFMFAMLVNLLLVAFRKQDKYKTFRIHPRKWVLLIAIVLGALLELYQGSVFVERTSDPADFIANIAGACIGLWMFRLIYGRELANEEIIERES